MRDERFTEDPFICYCLVLEWNNFQTAAGYMHPLGIFAWQILTPSLRAIFRLTFQIYESHAFQEISVFRAFPPHPLSNDVSACTLKKQSLFMLFVVHSLNPQCVSKIWHRYTRFSRNIFVKVRQRTLIKFTTSLETIIGWWNSSFQILNDILRMHGC